MPDVSTALALWSMIGKKGWGGVKVSAPRCHLEVGWLVMPKNKLLMTDGEVGQSLDLLLECSQQGDQKKPRNHWKSRLGIDVGNAAGE